MSALNGAMAGMPGPRRHEGYEGDEGDEVSNFSMDQGGGAGPRPSG